MIPLEYRLGESVRIEANPDGTWRVISELPLAVLTVNAAARGLLESARSGAAVSEIASGLSVSEERVFDLCEHFRSRGILEIEGPRSGSDATPLVTVIVPTRDRVRDLDECLGALARLDYPGDRLEVVVVDDGSADRGGVAKVVSAHGCRLLANARNLGPSYSRNRAAGEATGEILALLDSDCVAGPDWLRELTRYFSWEQVGAVGGRTLGYYTDSALDRYEEVSSPLDMGSRLVVKGPGTDTFYVPTCNLLVRRSAYLELGGLREDLSVGEDVDFCWRLRASGSYLFYAPEGAVRHKHRSRLGPMLRRRAEYGTSEATLYALHRDKRKRFPLAPAPLATTIALFAALVTRRPGLLGLCFASLVWDGIGRSQRLRQGRVDLPAGQVWSSVSREHMAMLYFAHFHLVRYYLVLLAAVSLLAPGVRLLVVLAVLHSAGVDYSTKRPRLQFLTYLGFYTAEHAAYQAGVLMGCVRSRTFRSYLPVLGSPRLAGGLSFDGSKVGRAV